MKQVLTTWGNAAYTTTLECKNGFLYGTLLDPSGNAFFTISFAKGKYGIIKWLIYYIKFLKKILYYKIILLKDEINIEINFIKKKKTS